MAHKVKVKRSKSVPSSSDSDNSSSSSSSDSDSESTSGSSSDSSDTSSSSSSDSSTSSFKIPKNVSERKRKELLIVKQCIRSAHVQQYERKIIVQLKINSIAKMEACTPERFKEVGMRREERKKLLEAFRKRLEKNQLKRKGEDGKRKKNIGSKEVKMKKNFNAKVEKRKESEELDLRTEALLQFYQRVDPKMNCNRDHLRKVIKNYPGGPGNLAIFLDRKYQDVPEGWETLYERAYKILELGRQDLQDEHLTKQSGSRSLVSK